MRAAHTKELGRSGNWYGWSLFRTTGSEIDRILTLSMAFSVVLVMARIAYTGKFTFIWLNWNLFLAWLPYRISSWLQQRPPVQTNKWKFAAVFLVWLLLH